MAGILKSRKCQHSAPIARGLNEVFFWRCEGENSTCSGLLSLSLSPQKAMKGLFQFPKSKNIMSLLSFFFFCLFFLSVASTDFIHSVPQCNALVGGGLRDGEHDWEEDTGSAFKKRTIGYNPLSHSSGFVVGHGFNPVSSSGRQLALGSPHCR